MRRHLLFLLLCLCPGVVLADDGDELLRSLLAKSDVVVLGEFTSEPFGLSDEPGIVHYQGEFKIAQLIQGEVLGDRRVGGTIKANAVRYEIEPEDRLPILTKGGKCILFLKCNDRQSPPSYVTSDHWFGIQRPSVAMAKALSRLAKEPPKQAVIEPHPAKARPNPQPAPVQVQLAGEWRLFLPAGYEHPVNLTSETANRYRWKTGLVFGGQYEVQGDQLKMIEANEPTQAGYVWKIQSPYLLTLVEHAPKFRSDYTGAVLFRLSPAAEVRLQREAPTGEAARLPRTTIEELDAMAKAGNYHLVRQQKIGHQLESVGVVRSLGKGHPDWVLVDLPGEIWGATLRNVRENHGLKPGDKVKFRGLIVAEGYSAFTIWVDESSQLAE